MTDDLTAEQRSACMRSIRGKDTKPEMFVRRLVHSLGFRYALHVKRLPGTPDLVFVARRKVIFVHGCFWHKHNCRRGRISPVNNSEYWAKKRETNANRDAQQVKALRKDGWKVLIIWECRTRNEILLRKKLESFLELS